MASKKQTYEDRFSGRTRAIIRTLTNIFLDSGLDVRHKHMFGHKAFLVRGHVFLLVGEWAREERRKEKIVIISDEGDVKPTLIVVPTNETTAEAFRKANGGLYFAPGGSRLKNWLSFSGDWLSDEKKLLPVIQELLDAYSSLPQKNPKNPGLMV